MLSISQTEKLPPKLAVKASLKKRSHAAMFPSREEKMEAEDKERPREEREG